MNKFEYGIAKNIEGAFDFLKEPDSKIKAGGIDVLDLMKEGLEAPKRLVNIRSVPDLRFINKGENGELRIGATTTLAEIESSKTIKAAYPALAQAAATIATPQIRNVATIGGNLCQRPRCWYFRSEDFHCLRNGGDTCFAEDGENRFHAILGNEDDCVVVHPSGTAVALMALGARLVIAKNKEKRELALADFWVTPEDDVTKENILQHGELITEIILPKPRQNESSFYFKQQEKQSFDWPIADVAVSLKLKGKQCEDARIVLGSAAPIPWRVKAAEQVLQGKPISIKLAKQAADAAMKDAKPLSENAYKVAVFKAVIYRTICWAAGVDPFAT
ncbi:MAG: xanthine dehydrogenase family protein subunit M [Calditrichaeota bacterium]|nr:MAG: xanthine dehydrogenase family protein subunit M [Calditrichota bacterium]